VSSLDPSITREAAAPDSLTPTVEPEAPEEAAVAADDRGHAAGRTGRPRRAGQPRPEAGPPAEAAIASLGPGGRLIVQPGVRTVFVREAEWKTGSRMPAAELASWLLRRRVRELVLLTMLSEHRYLTTEQLRALFFPSLRSAQLHLRRLAQELRLVMRWPQLEPVVANPGPAPSFWGWRRCSSLFLLTERGAAVVAAYRKLEPQSVVRRSWYAAEYCYHLEHDLETNGFWVSLAASARELPDQGLYHWVGDDSMRRNYQERGVDLAPDGWGRYLTAAGEVLFSLEWDRGTEAPQRLSRKAQAYLAQPEGAGNVLVVVPGATREASIREAIGRGLPAGRSLRFWTTQAGLLRDRGPLGPVWLEVGGRGTDRLQLAALPARARSSRRVEDCIGKPTWWERRPGGGEGAEMSA
jgi:hypothetical protein